jgi:hypothetical protein
VVCFRGDVGKGSIAWSQEGSRKKRRHWRSAGWTRRREVTQKSQEGVLGPRRHQPAREWLACAETSSTGEGYARQEHLGVTSIGWRVRENTE